MAELEAKPRYDEALRPAKCKAASAFSIVTWNVASLSSTLKKDPRAISRLAEIENAHVVCLQVASDPKHICLDQESRQDIQDERDSKNVTQLGLRGCEDEQRDEQEAFVQETKLQSKATESIEESLDLPGWHFFWACSDVKKGYSGTAIFSRFDSISWQSTLDEKGRLPPLAI